jgi:uncharacterized phage protein (TIGR01671 family)
MNREIKFRAWDKKNKEWFGAGNPNSLTFVGFTIFGECTMLCTPRLEEIANMEIMQYTGIKDKEGVEIYEGDILKWNAKEWGCEFNEVVEWDFELLNARKYDWAEWCEVIGNIYENPELLEVDK